MIIKQKVRLDFKEIKDTELYSFLAKKVFNLDDEKISEVNFVFWFVYYVERNLKGTLSRVPLRYIKSKGFSGDDESVSDFIDSCMDELTFSSKINVYEKIMRGTDFQQDVRENISICRKLNDLRNQVSHNKIENLLYKNKLVKYRETREEMINDYYNSLPDKKII